MIGWILSTVSIPLAHVVCSEDFNFVFFRYFKFYFDTKIKLWAHTKFAGKPSPINWYAWYNEQITNSTTATSFVLHDFMISRMENLDLEIGEKLRKQKQTIFLLLFRMPSNRNWKRKIEYKQTAKMKRKKKTLPTENMFIVSSSLSPGCSNMHGNRLTEEKNNRMARVFECVCVCTLAGDPIQKNVIAWND